MLYHLWFFRVVICKVKKHIKQGQGHEGGIFTVEAPLHVSNVQVVDPVTGYLTYQSSSITYCVYHNPLFLIATILPKNLHKREKCSYQKNRGSISFWYHI